MRVAMRPVGEKSAPTTSFAPIFPSKREARDEFASIIHSFENGVIANDADVSKETVKCWKAGRAFPNGENLIKLAFKNRIVLGWLLAKLNVRQIPEFMTDEVLTVMMAMLHQGMFQLGPDGDAVRELKRGGK